MESDFSNNYLGYWTDNGQWLVHIYFSKRYHICFGQTQLHASLKYNYLYLLLGAYYYYLTESGKTYQQTLFDVKTYADKMNIPYRYA